MEITIKYDGEYPNLCSGNLEVEIDGKNYRFPDYSLCSGGSIVCSSMNEEVIKGEWNLVDWPKHFTPEMKVAVLKKINEEIPHGCCGGCI